MEHSLSPESFLPNIRIEYDEYGISFELHKDTVWALTEIAMRDSISYPTAIVQAIANEKFLSDLEMSGHRLLVEQGNRIRYLNRSSAH